MPESIPESIEALAVSRATRLLMADSFPEEITCGSRCGDSMLVTGLRAQIQESNS
jgi:hypothetical protein